MVGRNHSGLVLWTINFLPHYRSHEVLFAKYVIAKKLKLAKLVIINRYENNPLSLEQVLRKFETFLHKRKPFAMAIGVFIIYVTVIELPLVLFSSIVRRVDVYYIKATLMSVV